MSTPSRSLSALVFAAILGLGACADNPTAPAAAASASASPLASKAATAPSVAKYEVYYMEFTINHHFAGIQEATLCVQRAVHAELRQLCEMSLQTQQRQIAQLRTWLRDWYGIDYAPELETSDAQTIRRLSALSGAAFEDEFLTEFSKHHLRIIKESEKAVRTVEHDELRALARMIITEQSQQVVRMQTWDCQWYNDCRRGLINQVS